LGTIGVGHEVNPVSPVRRAEARSREYHRPDGVSQRLQVIVNKVEPRLRVSGRNLLTKDRCRSALADEMEPCRPQVPLVSKPLSPACLAERLARAGSGPDGAIVGPAGASEGVGPDADAGEEVALSVSHKFRWYNIPDIPLIDVAGGDQVVADQFA
jgi:hypothetical protein